MNFYRQVLCLFLLAAVCCGCSSRARLKGKIEDKFAKEKGTFALAFLNPATGDTILINGHEIFHAASTMKTPVMIGIFQKIEDGKMALTDSLPVKNEFKSIADGSTYSLSVVDDSDSSLYLRVGKKATVADLLTLMITVSSNLATNLLIEQVDPGQVTQAMYALGARNMKVLRGVEDAPAYRKGWNNTVTAYDLMTVYSKMAEGKIISPKASDAMIAILRAQKFNEHIPAGLPTTASVAHKTGWFKGVQHDSGIIYLASGKKYILILLSKDLANDEEANRLFPEISRMVYKYVK